MEILNTYKVKMGEDVQLEKHDTEAASKKPDNDEIDKLLEQDTEGIAALQYKLYAEDRRSLLIILQGMDGSGKDSAIKHIMTGVNPQGVDVFSFKQPTEEELRHDFLWRHYIKLPAKGKIVVFNRSYYENVLVARVHPELVLAERLPGLNTLADIDDSFWENRYRQINAFEEIQVRNGTTILKFFLHLSKKEQRKRFLKRLDDREKNWKFSAADIRERVFWSDYQRAYENMLKHTSTGVAPWYIIPADNKWCTHLAIGRIILETLQAMNPALPQLTNEDERLISLAKTKLEDKEDEN